MHIRKFASGFIMMALATCALLLGSVLVHEQGPPGLFAHLSHLAPLLVGAGLAVVSLFVLALSFPSTMLGKRMQSAFVPYEQLCYHLMVSTKRLVSVLARRLVPEAHHTSSRWCGNLVSL